MIQFLFVTYSNFTFWLLVWYLFSSCSSSMLSTYWYRLWGEDAEQSWERVNWNNLCFFKLLWLYIPKTQICFSGLKRVGLKILWKSRQHLFSLWVIQNLSDMGAMLRHLVYLIRWTDCLLFQNTSLANYLYLQSRKIEAKTSYLGGFYFYE